jgi:oligopeptide/dipeptide ABC transporter ATP-binding protein
LSSDDATRKLRSGSRVPQLSVEGLSVELPVKQGLLRRTVGQLKVLDRVELRVLRGQTVAVVGEAGAGKTTLGRAIARLVPSSAGRVLLAGKDLAALDDAERRQALAQILLLTAETVGEPAHLAAVRTGAVKLLILDEAIDPGARPPLLAEIRRLQDEQALSCLVLTRSLQVASAISDEVVVMHEGQLVESGASADLVSHPHHPYTRGLLGAVTEPALSASVASGCRFRARCPEAFSRCAAEEPTWFAVPGGLCRCFLHDPDGAER